RSLGAQIVSNLMEDAKTSGRWFFAVVMGRTAGHLALGIGKSVGATVTIIPEEFGEGKIKLQQLVDILTGSIIKRLAGDKSYGVAVIAEGLFEKIDQESVLQCACRDEHGHIRYTEVNFADLLKQAVLQELSLLGINMTFVGKEIGY
ncbi:MAG: 6-phosphofructokinase, partial [Negativicutes bacterium]|nr:6-phosphofructokinase [Negativicutes bacterium]